MAGRSVEEEITREMEEKLLMDADEEKEDKRKELQTTVMREPLPSKLRLGMTLMFLAQGETVQSLYNKFRVGKSIVHRIIEETCKAIWEKLQPIYLSQLTKNDFERIAAQFFDLWQLSNCMGAIDGRHMRIKAPPMSGSEFYNYKGFFSVVLLAAVDAHYKFIWVDIGQYGSISDGRVWSNSDFGQALDHGEVDLPLDKPLPGTDISFLHFFVGDEAFPLKKYLMRPFPGRMHQALKSPLVCSVEKAEDIIKALVCLHNMLMDNKDDGYVNPVQLELELQDGNIQGRSLDNCSSN
ncbi:uncharacterized protein [Temnothorax nylanderi]|uniref:uncharacterized protein n=1 Tax=Temnothorax nylanderi TaxID=102681 RepID=UPI003A85C0AD